MTGMLAKVFALNLSEQQQSVLSTNISLPKSPRSIYMNIVFFAISILALSAASPSHAQTESADSAPADAALSKHETVVYPKMIHELSVQDVISTRVIKPARDRFRDGEHLVVLLSVVPVDCTPLSDAKILISSEFFRGSRKVVHLFAFREPDDGGHCSAGRPVKLAVKLFPSFSGPSTQEFILPGSPGQLYKNGKTVIQIKFDNELGKILSVKVEK